MNNLPAVRGVTVPVLTEFDYANLLQQAIPPLKTVGKTWRTYVNGVWRDTKRDAFRPAAQDVMPEFLRTSKREAALLDHLEGRLQTTADQFRGFHRFSDDGGILLNAANGIVHVAQDGTTDLLPHSPEHFFTRQLAANYEPDATPALFQKVLADVLPDPDDRNLLQLFCGNIFLPDCRHEAALVGYGEAGRGKSTVANPIATVLGSPLVSRLSMSQVCDPKSYHLPQLQFAAVNLGTELDAIAVEESANFKTIVSGEPVQARPIYGEPFVMQTAAKLWFLANGLPRFKNGTEAELRRLRFIRFDYLPPQKDVTLKTRLEAERDGVFNFMLEGLRNLQLCREIPIGSAHSKEVHARFRVSNDPLGAFVEAECDFKPAGYVPKDRLANAFESFCSKHGLPFSDIGGWVFRRLYERFPNVEAKQRRIAGDQVWCVVGLELKTRLEIE